ncbi:hypothetical protein B9Z55_023061 [Caenorhabditis nigoni]|uniref:Uncharacterized protein n=1 Tax=Caenorhabditis nigoni TaxID=1611254 RepID=A0A2G5SN18_9PELO|nr:hypothetical protein B9Z55_023061 [Caenorhabditis nigoni]
MDQIETPSINELLQNALNETEGVNIADCQGISNFLSSARMSEEACRNLLDFVPLFLNKVQHQEHQLIMELKAEEEKEVKDEGRIDSLKHHIPLISVTAIISSERLLNKMMQFENGVVGDEYEKALQLLVLRYKLDTSVPVGVASCRKAMREHFLKILEDPPTWSYGAIQMWQNIFECFEIDEQLKQYYVEHGSSLPSKALENDHKWVYAARRFFEFAESTTNNAVSDHLLGELVQHQEEALLERVHQILNYSELRKGIPNAALYEELLKCLRLFFGLAPRQIRSEDHDNEGFRKIREIANTLTCRFNKRFHSPQQENYFSQYYDCVALVIIWMEMDNIRDGQSGHDKKNKENEDFSSLFILLSNMIRCAENLPYNMSRNFFPKECYPPPNVAHYLHLLVDIKKSYPQFFTEHPSMANAIRQLVLENYVNASQRRAPIDGKLLQVYEAVKQIFEIPAIEELRRIEPSVARVEREGMQDQSRIYSLCPKINLRMDEEARLEQRPIIDGPQLDVVLGEARPMEDEMEGVVNRNDVPPNAGINGIAPEQYVHPIVQDQMLPPGRGDLQEPGSAPLSNASSTSPSIIVKTEPADPQDREAGEVRIPNGRLVGSHASPMQLASSGNLGDGAVAIEEEQRFEGQEEGMQNPNGFPSNPGLNVTAPEQDVDPNSHNQIPQVFPSGGVVFQGSGTDVEHPTGAIAGRNASLQRSIPSVLETEAAPIVAEPRVGDSPVPLLPVSMELLSAPPQIEVSQQAMPLISVAPEAEDVDDNLSNSSSNISSPEQHVDPHSPNLMPQVFPSGEKGVQESGNAERLGTAPSTSPGNVIEFEQVGPEEQEALGDLRHPNGTDGQNDDAPLQQPSSRVVEPEGVVLVAEPLAGIQHIPLLPPNAAPQQAKPDTTVALEARDVEDNPSVLNGTTPKKSVTHYSNRQLPEVITLDSSDEEDEVESRNTKLGIASSTPPINIVKVEPKQEALGEVGTPNVPLVGGVPMQSSSSVNPGVGDVVLGAQQPVGYQHFPSAHDTMTRKRRATTTPQLRQTTSNSARSTPTQPALSRRRKYDLSIRTPPAVLRSQGKRKRPRRSSSE